MATTKKTRKTTSTSKTSASKTAKTSKAKTGSKTRKAKTAKPKASSKAKVPSKAKEQGTKRANDLPWGDKKVAIFRALKALRATSALGARSTADIAAKAEVSGRDVRHYCYHAKAAGLVDIAKTEEIARGYGFFLTKKGVKVNPVAEQKAQKAEK